jgi:hypothetical protein
MLQAIPVPGSDSSAQGDNHAFNAVVAVGGALVYADFIRINLVVLSQ